MTQGEQRTIGAAMAALNPKVRRRLARRSFLKDAKFPNPATFDSIESNG
jgi:hypothetical protein